jgi:hypothetical protein
MGGAALSRKVLSQVEWDRGSAQRTLEVRQRTPENVRSMDRF